MSIITLTKADPTQAISIRVTAIFSSLSSIPMALPLKPLPLVTHLVLGHFGLVTSYTWSVSGRQLLQLVNLLPALSNISVASVNGAHVIGQIAWNVGSLELGFGPRQPVRRIHYHGTANVQWANYHDQSITVVSTHLHAPCHGNVIIVNH